MQLSRFGEALAELNAAIGQESGDAKTLRLKALAAYGNARGEGTSVGPRP